MKTFEKYTLIPIFEKDYDQFFRFSKDYKKLIISEEPSTFGDSKPEIIQDALNMLGKHKNGKKYLEYKNTMLEATILLSLYKCIIETFVMGKYDKKIILYWNEDLTFKTFEILRNRNDEVFYGDN